MRRYRKNYPNNHQPRKFNTMKTKIISTLKKELLVIELPEETYFEAFKHGILFKDHLEAEREFIEGSYTLLGSHEEIKEEDVKDLVEQSIFTSLYGNYVSGIDVNTYCYKNTIESFHSALESEIYWNVNPISKQLCFIGNVSEIDKQIALQKQKRRFEEAQEKTFDKSRTLIFVKN